MSIFRHFSKIIAVTSVAAVLLVACGNPMQEAGQTADTGPAASAQQRSAAAGDLPQVPEHMVNNTMYQIFYWDSYPGLWSDLPAMAQPLAEAGITSMWLPPAAKAMNGTFSVGYDVYDFWDLGEFDQKGTVPTRYGTRAELENALSALDGLGIDAYYDVVFNHRMGADSQQYVPGIGERWTQFDLHGRQVHYTPERWGYLYHDFAWDWTAFNGLDGQLFPDKWWGNTFHFPYLMGNDVDYNRQDVRHEMKAWGEWIIDDIGFSGFRMDAIAHVDTDFTRNWINHVQWATEDDVFFVAEAWVGDISGYLDAVNTPHLMAFDFNLREDFVNLSSGSKDMRWWGGLANSHHAGRAVTFIDNHDTSRAGNPYGMPQVINYKNQAYAYILMREHGVPTVFARDWDEFGMAPTLSRLVEARRYFAYGPGHETSANTDAVYTYVREGLADVPGTGLVMLISGRDWGGQQEFWINAHQPNTEFYDYTGNVDGTITTNGDGYANFRVNMSESTGWSVWVPVDGQGSDPEPGIGWEQAYFRGTPNSWGTTDMEQVSPGVWQVTADFTGQENPRFKIDRFGDWTENYPEQDYLIETAGTYVITFNDSTTDISIELQENDDPIVDPGDEITLRMTVDVGHGNSLYFTGSTEELSNWGTGVEGTWTSGNVWEVTINDPGSFEWKTRIGPTGGEGQGWESGGNHTHENLHPAHQGW
ncbi:alpha-amylase family glycosyl hydrolase [Spirochaeta africana]|uniref:Alpha-amylase n=1 Tax=Spirochaeta africana (strain ATCC 700263 / DSM 8902 / Z-7692) TaxID=889378 RepID=H9UM09_SPIAZ|nr:alpha-amylase family glycosyl hydrolase [Spirochaeta africana]AFG38552.1 glycosidase [Spirochaeta africana DSM 8902]